MLLFFCCFFLLSERIFFLESGVRTTSLDELLAEQFALFLWPCECWDHSATYLPFIPHNLSGWLAGGASATAPATAQISVGLCLSFHPSPLDPERNPSPGAA